METNNNLFKEHCSQCGYELEIHIDNRFNYITKWCRGSCPDPFN